MASPLVGAGLIDTNILIDALRGQPSAVAFVVHQQSAGVAHASVITAMELVSGSLNSPFN